MRKNSYREIVQPVLQKPFGEAGWSLSWGRGRAGQAYLSTPREESSRKDPLAAELGASAREDR